MGKTVDPTPFAIPLGRRGKRKLKDQNKTKNHFRMGCKWSDADIHEINRRCELYCSHLFPNGEDSEHITGTIDYESVIADKHIPHESDKDRWLTHGHCDEEPEPERPPTVAELAAEHWAIVARRRRQIQEDNCDADGPASTRTTALAI